MIERRIKTINWKIIGAFAFALVCFSMASYYLIFGYGAYLDADMSSELALASHLAKEGKLISDTWLYSTEVRVLGTQLVYMPLMMLFPHDWQMVRTLGGMILLAMMACTSYYSARKIGAEKHYAWIFAGLGVLPISIIYAQMIVIGTFYVPHAILINVFVAWAVSVCAQKHWIKTSIGLCVLGMFMCATSIRYLLCAILPVAAMGLYGMVFPRNEGKRSNGEKRVFVVSFAAAALGVVGYAVGERIFAANFLWDPNQFGGRRLVSLTSENLFELMDQSMDGLMKMVGFMESRHLISIQGLLSLGALGLIVLAFMLVVRRMKESCQDEKTHMAVLAFVMSAVMTWGTFLFVENMYVNRYWIPVMTLGGPIMALCLTKEQNTALRRMAGVIFACVALGLSAAQIKNSMASPQIGAVERENAACVESTGVKFGYASFWNANNLTELTNGYVEAVAFRVVEGKQGNYPDLNMWLEVQADREMNRPEETVFMLLSQPEKKQLSAFLEACGAEEVQMPYDNQALFIIDSQRTFFDVMQAFKDNTGA